jgi:hypothetical protein
MTTVNKATKNSLKALESVARVLSEIGWEPQKTKYKGVLRIDFTGENIPIAEAMAEVSAEFERFIYYLNFGDRVAAHQSQQMMEFVTRANFGLVTGNFEFNLDDGEVRFKSSIDFSNTELNETLIRNLIRSSMDAVEQYADAAVKVIRGELKSKEAIDEVEGRSENQHS